ncbi:MAG: radical SAM protein [Bacteroidetes bacterium]|nr:radical SAM protein [Bacteroidota bacterium]
MKDYNHCESLYWVFTQLCNDTCDHCYNLSGPKGARISEDECLAIIDNLPERIDRVILSGGEPLADKKKLYLILDRLKEKYGSATQIMLQTNGDLLTDEILDTLIHKGVTRFDIASIDRYHKLAGAKLMEIASLFESRGVNGDDKDPLIEKETYLTPHRLSWGYWGATEDMWLGGNWARGRALQKDVWKKDPNHNFCAILSGAKGFLGGTELPQEISIQLWRINPCCPGTKFPMGDARKEKVVDVMNRVAQSKVFQKLNEGDPWKMGESMGVTEVQAKTRTTELQNICLWCDEFFDKHYDIEKLQPK